MFKFSTSGFKIGQTSWRIRTGSFHLVYITLVLFTFKSKQQDTSQQDTSRKKFIMKSEKDILQLNWFEF